MENNLKSQISRVYELDAKRTAGTWNTELESSVWSIRADDFIIVEEPVAEQSYREMPDGSNGPVDLLLMAEAPTMVSIIRTLDTERTQLLSAIDTLNAKLGIARDALKEYSEDYNTGDGQIARDALKQLEDEGI